VDMSYEGGWSMRRILLTAVVLLTVVFGCHEDRTGCVSDKGTVVFLSFEGGFYGIVDDHGRRWDPSNLSEQFKVDSLRVRFEGVVADHPTYHMWGRTVELTSIKRLD
jgi:hypothetical protein